jgi:hypothetical protein
MWSYFIARCSDDVRSRELRLRTLPNDHPSRVL